MPENLVEQGLIPNDIRSISTELVEMSIPDVTLLFQDLLSPSTTLLASTTPALITYHLSTLPLTSSSTQLVTPLLRYLVTSPALWRGQAQQQSSASASQIWEPLNWSRGKEVYDAIRNGILYRVGEISKELGTGWRARRRLATFLDYFYAGLEDEGTGGIHPTVQMLVKSAVLKGLQLVKLRKDKLYVGGTAHLGKAEAEVLKAWEEYARVQEWGTSRGSSVDLNGQGIHFSHLILACLRADIHYRNVDSDRHSPNLDCFRYDRFILDRCSRDWTFGGTSFHVLHCKHS